MSPRLPADPSQPLELDPAVLEAAIKLYEDIHAHPELGWQEHGTVERLQRFLVEHGVPVANCPVQPGVMVDITGGQPGEPVLVRADLDALPIEEECELPFRSQTPGVMHACGHDLHTAILATLAVHLQRNRESLVGTRRLVWQPSEEANPSGAEAICDAGLADGVRAAIALHVDPRLQIGHVSFRAGVTNAAVDGVGILLRGPGGHGARPHLTPDVVRVAALLKLELDDTVRRRVSAQDAAVLTITTIQTGQRSNVVPDQAWLDGTLRTFSKTHRDALLEAVRETLNAMTVLYGVEAELELRVGQPALDNDAVLTELSIDAAEDVIGPGSVVIMPAPSLGADDFSVFGDKSPIMMLRLGTYSGKGEPTDIHTPRFRANLDALPIGARLLASVAERAARTPA